MASKRNQKNLHIERQDLREKYHNESQLRAMCKAIGKYAHSQITVQSKSRDIVRFEIIGHRIDTAIEHLVHEVCERRSYSKLLTKKSDKEVVRSSQRAQMVMSETKQDKILQQGIVSNFLLTEDALAKHNLQTGASELREFACGNCDQYWWQVVLITKAVSTCHRCDIKLDALPRQLEFGIGRYICQNKTCKHRTFYCKCQATEAVRCHNCNGLVHNPYIHPKFRKSKQKRTRKPLNPKAKPFEPPPPSVSFPRPLPPLPMYYFLYGQGIPPLPPPSPPPLPPTLPPPLPLPVAQLPEEQCVPLIQAPKRNVINPSTPHIPTGSTIGTFLTQASLASNISVDVVDSASDSSRGIILVSSDSDSSSDEEQDSQAKVVLSDDESDTRVSSVASKDHPDSDSDSDDDYRKRLLESDSSCSSDSNDSSDTSEGDLNDDVPSESSSGKLSSQASTMLDSGVGTASFADSLSIEGAKPTSIGDTTSVSSSDKFNALSVADVKVQYPGVLFSKDCRSKEVDHIGTVITGEGIEVSIPPKALDPGDKVPMAVQACLKGPFKFRRAYVPTTSMYLLYPPCVFHEKVRLKFKTFADIQDEDKIVFFTSPDNPEIRGEESRWKFREDTTAVVHWVAGNREVAVDITHFCFGGLFRRRRRNQKNFYLISLYKPVVQLPTCHAIFTVHLDDDVHCSTLQSFLTKKYGTEAFEDTQYLTQLLADEIEPVIHHSSDDDTTITPDMSPCKILRSVIDLPLKNKKYRRATTSYPPKIVYTIQRNPGAPERLRPLAFTVQVRGADREFILSIPPSRSPSMSSSRSSHSESSEDAPTFDELVRRTGATSQQLEQECSPEHLNLISEEIYYWQLLAKNLGLSPAAISAIETNPHIADHRAREVLKKWHEKNIFMASYKALASVMIQQSNTRLAKKIILLSKK